MTCQAQSFGKDRRSVSKLSAGFYTQCIRPGYPCIFDKLQHSVSTIVFQLSWAEMFLLVQIKVFLFCQKKKKILEGPHSETIQVGIHKI